MSTLGTPCRRLGDVCRVQKGTTITEKEATPGPIPVVAGGMRPTYFHNTHNRSAGVVTISASGANAGYVNYWDAPIWASDCTTVEVSDAGQTSNRYVFHFLKSVEATTIASRRRGAAQPHVYAKDIQEIEIHLPPIEEQRRIASILDAADALRAKRRQAIETLDSLTQSIFIDMFGSFAESVPLGELADVQGGLQVSAQRAGLPLTAPYLRVANVFRGRLDLSEIKMIHLSSAEFQRTKLANGDLLVVEGHGNKDEVGRVAMWDGSIADCVHQNHLIRARCDTDHLVPQFAETYLNTPIGRRALLRAANTTSGLNTISANDVRSTPVLCPPLASQQAFALRRQGVENLRTKATSASTNADSLFASLQHRAFRGEL